MENKVLTNFWFKRDEEEVFHAFIQPRLGMQSICRKSQSFGLLDSMNIPHDRSKCCNVCMDSLYGTKTVPVKEKV